MNRQMGPRTLSEIIKKVGCESHIFHTTYSLGSIPHFIINSETLHGNF